MGLKDFKSRDPEFKAFKMAMNNYKDKRGDPEIEGLKMALGNMDKDKRHAKLPPRVPIQKTSLSKRMILSYSGLLVIFGVTLYGARKYIDRRKREDMELYKLLERKGHDGPGTP